MSPFRSPSTSLIHTPPYSHGSKSPLGIDFKMKANKQSQKTQSRDLESDLTSRVKNNQTASSKNGKSISSLKKRLNPSATPRFENSLPLLK